MSRESSHQTFVQRLPSTRCTRRYGLRALVLLLFLPHLLQFAAAAQPGAEGTAGTSSGRGELRLALFGPQYSVDAGTGSIRGDVHLVEIASMLAGRLDLRLALATYPDIPALLTSLQNGSSDVAFLGAGASLPPGLEASNPVFELDYGVLVHGRSTIRTVDDVDQPGLKVAVARNHPSAVAFMRWVKRANVVVADSPDMALALFQSGEADALASTANAVLAWAAKGPDSRMLEGRYGFTASVMVVGRNQRARLPVLHQALEEAKTDGRIQRAIERGAVRGLRAAPPVPARGLERDAPQPVDGRA